MILKGIWGENSRKKDYLGTRKLTGNYNGKVRENESIP